MKSVYDKPQMEIYVIQDRQEIITASLLINGGSDGEEEKTDFGTQWS